MSGPMNDVEYPQFINDWLAWIRRNVSCYRRHFAAGNDRRWRRDVVVCQTERRPSPRVLQRGQWWYGLYTTSRKHGGCGGVENCGRSAKVPTWRVASRADPRRRGTVPPVERDIRRERRPRQRCIGVDDGGIRIRTTYEPARTGWQTLETDARRAGRSPIRQQAQRSAGCFADKRLSTLTTARSARSTRTPTSEVPSLPRRFHRCSVVDRIKRLLTEAGGTSPRTCTISDGPSPPDDDANWHAIPRLC